MGDLFDPFGMGTGSAVGSTVGSSRPASGPDLFGDLLGSDSSGTSGFSSAHANATPASNKSLFDLSKYISSCCCVTISALRKRLSTPRSDSAETNIPASHFLQCGCHIHSSIDIFCKKLLGKINIIW